MYEKDFKPVQKGKLSLVLDAYWGDPKDPNNPDDVKAAVNYNQMQTGMLAYPIFSEESNYPSFVREFITSIVASILTSKLWSLNSTSASLPMNFLAYFAIDSRTPSWYLTDPSQRLEYSIRT